MPSAAYYAAMERLAKGRAANSSSKKGTAKTGSSASVYGASPKPKPKPKPTPNVRQAVAADKKKSQSTVKSTTSSSSNRTPSRTPQPSRRPSSSSSSSTPSRTSQPDRRTPSQKAKGTAKTGSSASVYGAPPSAPKKPASSGLIGLDAVKNAVTDFVLGKDLGGAIRTGDFSDVGAEDVGMAAAGIVGGPAVKGLQGASAVAKGLSAASKSKGTTSLGKATPKAKEAGASGLGTAVSRSQMNSLAKQEAAMVSRTAPSRAPSPSRPSQTPQPAKTPTPSRQPTAPTSAKPSRSPWDLPSPAKAPKAPFRGPVGEPEVPLRDKPEENQPPQEFAPTPTTDAPVVPELDFTPTPTPRDTPEVSNNIGTRPGETTKTDKVTKTDPGKGNQPKTPKTRTVVSPPRVRRPLDSGTPGEPNPEPFRRSTIGQEVGIAGRQPSPGSVTRSFMSSPDDNEGVQATRPLPGRSRNNELSEGAGGLGPEERAAMLRQRRRTSED